MRPDGRVTHLDLDLDDEELLALATAIAAGLTLRDPMGRLRPAMERVAEKLRVAGGDHHA